MSDRTVAGSDPAASVGKKSYYEMISDDTDIWRFVIQIMNGSHRIADISAIPSHFILPALLTRLAAMLYCSQ
jgi:hypothetical protein